MYKVFLKKDYYIFSKMSYKKLTYEDFELMMIKKKQVNEIKPNKIINNISVNCNNIHNNYMQNDSICKSTDSYTFSFTSSGSRSYR